MTDFDSLAVVLGAITVTLGCRYFALTHHVDFANKPSGTVRIHNYPHAWEVWFDAHGLGISDPVHRASHKLSRGFRWSEARTLLPFAAKDQAILDAALAHGIGDGFTVPSNIPGQLLGSCTFATTPECAISDDNIPAAQVLGLLAFDKPCALTNTRIARVAPALTPRQREVVMLVARGKSDWEIAIILAISHGTATGHVREARQRYGTSNRILLAVRAIADGTISVHEIIGL
ncbi:LuxR family transcriptional regulator [Sphingomonas sp.]|uniref:helix-turn-helix transcriptional regulator n=1 Tax=Sphingomonas sp. TaxID=28214 RepID=UPI0025DC14EE|nr:LuxR family transcriptional regulator [Sphingomonas sp.]